MRGKIVCVVASCLAALSLTIVSCTSPQVTAPTATGPTAGAPATKASPGTATTEQPKAGGVLNVVLTNDPTGFDQGPGATLFQMTTNYLTHDELLRGDWSKGPAGTKEFSFLYPGDLGYDSKGGNLAESWSIAEPGHMVFKIRQGVRFGLNPNSEASGLVNGREMTAEDVAYSLNRVIKENPYIRASAANMVNNTTVTAPDKYTVDVKFPPEETLFVMSYLIVNVSVVPQEVVAKYGNLSDWKVSVGTGPFMLTDYVSGSSLTFAKNPNFWGKDPAGPGKGNQLPYLDGVKTLIMPDPSTRMTALRTGKIDTLGHMPALNKEDFDQLISTTPKLQSVKYLSSDTTLVYMRTDKQDQPFKDARVRQALTMAIDYKSIVDQLMLGEAEYPGSPTHSAPDFKGIYFPLSEAPKTVQDMYSYNPTRAKELLAEAGYPNGFSAKILTNATGGVATDQVAVFKDFWSKIGVDLAIDAKEFAVYNKEASSRTYDQMMYGLAGNYWIYIRMINWDGGTQFNGSYINDERAKKAKADMQAAMAKGDLATANSIYKEFEKYAMEQAWTIPYPRQYNYVVWWPWLKNYHGENTLSFAGSFTWARYVWLDQDLKKSMIGQ